ncbi:phosphate ABC transporter substrate-binding protein [Nostoc sp. CHAB 5834]|nr:phosphate ABC transporter substrate-binding protein [Nostoc sp. CHAB 5834]
MARNWKCDGQPKNGKTYSNQNPTGNHEPYENYGLTCVMCNLPKEAMDNSPKLPKWVKPAAITGAAVLTALVAAFILIPTPCPIGQQKTNGVCLAITPDPNPTTPTPTPPITPTPTSVSPAAIVNLYPTLRDVPNVPQGIIRYGGSTSFAPVRSPAIVALIKLAHPGFELVYTSPTPGIKAGSGSGIKMLIEGQLNFSQSSRPLKDEEYESAKTRNFTLEQQAVAIDGIAFYVHRDLAIRGLTISQIKDIYTGKTTNWKEVGGPDIQITPSSRDPNDGGTPEYFQEKVLEKEAFAPSVEPYAIDTTTAIRKVAQTPGGIGYATASEVCPQSSVKPLPIGKEANKSFVSACIEKLVNKTDFAKDMYPLTRRLFVVIKRDRTLDEQAGVAYVNLLLSDEGQKLVDQAGLVPIRN